MKKIAFCTAAMLLATSAFAGPPPPPPGPGWGHGPRHHVGRPGHVIGAFALGIGVGSLLTPRTRIYHAPPPVTYVPSYTTTYTYTAPAPVVVSPTYTAPAPVVVSPVVTVPSQTVYAEKEPTKLFCRSKNNFYPKVQSCAEGWLEVVNR